MNSVRIELGFVVKRDKDNMSISRDESNHVLRKIKTEAATLFGAYTLIPTFGGWTNGNGRLTEEDGFTLFTIQPSALEDRPDASLTLKIKQLANFIKTQLNQEAIAYSATPVDFELI